MPRDFETVNLLSNILALLADVHGYEVRIEAYGVNVWTIPTEDKPVARRLIFEEKKGGGNG